MVLNPHSTEVDLHFRDPTTSGVTGNILGGRGGHRQKQKGGGNPQKVIQPPAIGTADIYTRCKREKRGGKSNPKNRTILNTGPRYLDPVLVSYHR